MSSIDIVNGLGRRKHPRREFSRGVGVLHAGQYQVQSGFEIGEGGLSFDSTIELPEGTFAVVSFQIPGGSFISSMVEVRRSSKEKNQNFFRVGCLFKNIKFDFKREIRAYVSARS